MPKKYTNTSLNKSKLIKLLAKLPPKTVKTFKAWYKQMGSPKRDAFVILDYLLLYYPDFDSPRLLQDIAFKKIFGQLPYDYRKLMKGVSQVHVDLKQYLVHQELAADDFLSDFLLARVYTKYNLTHERQLLLDKQLKQEKSLNHPQDFHELLEWQDFAFFIELQHTKNVQKSDIQKAMTALDWYFLGKKLKYACEIVTQKNLYNLSYPVNFEEEIIQFCKKNQADLPLYHQMYFMAWKLLTNPSRTIFDQLKDIFTQRYTEVPEADQLYLITHLLNYSSHLIRTKAHNGLKEAFSLYKIGIEQAILLRNQTIISSHFKNFIAVSSALEQFEWIDKMLATQLKQVLQFLPKSSYNLSMARLNFAKKDYQACITNLIEVDYSQFSPATSARIYQIACAYELNEPPTIIESHCKSFENYLRRNIEKNPNVVKANLNFISIVRRLNKFNPNKINIQNHFDSFTSISFYVWLQQKINNLK